MPRAGDEIENARTGQRMKFLVTAEESGGEVLRTENRNPPGQFEPVHIHPEQLSSAEVVSGSLLFVVAGREIRLGPGERIEIPAGTPHTFRNEGPEDAHGYGEFRPALGIAEFFETFFVLSQRGQLDAHGMPSLLQIAVSAPAFGREIRLASPPWLIQRLALAPLAVIARLRGLRPRYSWSSVEGVSAEHAAGGDRSSSTDPSTASLSVPDPAVSGRPSS